VDETVWPDGLGPLIGTSVTGDAVRPLGRAGDGQSPTRTCSGPTPTGSSRCPAGSRCRPGTSRCSTSPTRRCRRTCWSGWTRC
jgi:hypothetical protein